MSLLGHLYRGDTAFDFAGNRNRWFTVSAALIVISIAALLIRGLNLGIDFEGGTLIEAPNTAGVTIDDVRDVLTEIGQGNARVQIIEDGARFSVQTEDLLPAEQDELVAAVADAAGVAVDETQVDAVGPTFGAEITRRAVEALIIFLIVIVLFISWRFEWKMALAAVAALFHDLLITAGIYSLVGFEVTPSTVIAVLTILGYSLYDTVVVFDKVTENVTERGDRHSFAGIANLSMNQVLMRSINTSITTLLPVGALLFVGSFLLGASTLREFALALFIGIAAGTYSSIFVATPLLTVWKEREPQWQRAERRAARRGEVEPVPAVAAAPPATPGKAKMPPAAQYAGSGATPRPPKKRRKR